MIPAIGHYLSVAIRSMQDVVVPAIDESNVFAREQAALIVSALRVVADQWRFVDALEEMELRENLELCDALVSALAGHELETGFRLEVIALREAYASGYLRFNELLEMNNKLRTEIDLLLEAIRLNSTEALRSRIASVVIENSRRFLAISTARYAATGLDAAASESPGLEVLVKQG